MSQFHYNSKELEIEHDLMETDIAPRPSENGPPCSPRPHSVNNASGTRELSMNFGQFRNLSPVSFMEVAEA